MYEFCVISVMASTVVDLSGFHDIEDEIKEEVGGGNGPSPFAKRPPCLTASQFKKISTLSDIRGRINCEM